jgi:hypothetical protein
MKPLKFSPRKLLKWTWQLFCLSLMAWQGFRCTQEFLKRPVVTSASFERFTDKFLPEITVCPRDGQMSRGKKIRAIKEDKLAEHGLNVDTYLYGSGTGPWKSRNGSLTNEELHQAVSYKAEELVKRIKWSEVDEEGNYERKSKDIGEITHLWTRASFKATGACYKLDIHKVKKTTGQLNRFIIESQFPGGLDLHLNKADQAYDESISIEMGAKVVRDGYEDTHSFYTWFTVSLEVINSITTNKHPCSTEPFDSEMVKIATNQMMEVAGCVVLWVDRTQGAPLCDGGDENSTKALEIYDKIFKNTGLYGRRDVPPPCEYFIPTVKSEPAYARKDASNLTATADFSFKPQVQNLAQF